MSTFETQFRGLTGFEPFAWQTELFERFLRGDFPSLIDLPTGAGKTSVMHIWLLALAAQPDGAALPRRLVWVVDRRVVVDQATVEADRLAERLERPELAGVRSALVSLGASAAPLAISTLRGEHRDNRQWSEDPSRPAIIVGTVDMIGSRLLFSGYGDGRWRRPLHAGLLGQDTLIVNDEAHITPAFAELIQAVAARSNGPQPLRVMLLSATHTKREQEPFPASLDADLSNSEFARRYCATKRLHILEPVDKPRETIEELALQPHGRTLVFIRQPRQALEIANAIRKRHGVEVPVIAGTQRGYERDRLLQHETVRRFLSKDSTAQDAAPCWIVSTSAGEMGIDLTADRLITDLETADHLLQRFGRLNRFGSGEGGAYVVYSAKQFSAGREPARLSAGIAYLQSLDGDISPKKLRELPPPPEAMTPRPAIAPLDPWLVDVWSMTSIHGKEWLSRPAVEPWLRGGDEEDSPPETYVAWRAETADLVRESVSADDIEDVLDCFPILAQERLKQYTGSLKKELEDERYRDTGAILITAKDEIRKGAIPDLIQNESDLRFATLLLPPGVGALDRNGMVDWSKPGDIDPAEYDVSEVSGVRWKKRLALESEDEYAQDDAAKDARCIVSIPDKSGDGTLCQWAYWVEKGERNKGPAEIQLEPHLTDVAEKAALLAARLGFDQRLAKVFRWAGLHHDLGKSRLVWQRAGGNTNPAILLAKVRRLNGRALGGYRHELGSLLDAEAAIATENFTSEERDLCLHLIAAHHGRSRPHFDEEASDSQAILRSRQAILESARRFGRLQRRYGAWRLAYLEAVFRCADMLASAGAPEQSNNA